MARTNKYTSLNFNDIYEKKTNNNNSSPSTSATAAKSPSSYLSTATKSYSLSAASRLTHGGMLVLSRPSPKPQPSPPPSPSPKQPSPLTPPAAPAAKPDNDLISLRPKGKTGGTINLSPSPSPPSSEMGSVPKRDKFVPPHLRPGFVAKEVSSPPGPEFARARSGNHRPVSAHGFYHGSPNNIYQENGRPKSGGGYDRRVTESGAGFGESDLVYLNRPPSGGGRPSSSG